jgi:hypothetical protein
MKPTLLALLVVCIPAACSSNFDQFGSGGSTGSRSRVTSGGGEIGGLAGHSGSGGGSSFDASSGSKLDAASEDAALAESGFDAVLNDAAPSAVEASASASGCAGYALELDGLGEHGWMNRPVQNDFTIEAWIKTKASKAGSNFWEGNGLIYADAPGDANDFGSSILNDRFAFGIGNPNITLQSATRVTTGEWVHVATTRNQFTGLVQILVNGTVESAGGFAGPMVPLDSQSIVNIGANTIDNRYFAGTIDEVRVWNVVRTPAEIAATMHARLTGKENGLVAYFRFDETDGKTAANSAGDSTWSVSLVGGTRVPSSAPVCPP